MKDAPQKNDSTVSVIIVEDQELTRMGFIAMMNNDPSIKVIGEADNGKDAIALTLEMRPDVVVMDIGLPVMDGIEASRRIRECCPQAKFLMLTSHTEKNLVAAALSSGARGYCLKDINKNRLLAAVKAIAGGDVWLDPEIASIVFSLMQLDESKAQPQTEARVRIERDSSASSAIVRADELSERELEVLQLLVQGLRNSEIAEELCVTVDTVKSHMSRIMDKLAVSDRTQAALAALRKGIVSL
jgi:DNA-binding NarL/FixJ family response regulator